MNKTKIVAAIALASISLFAQPRPMHRPIPHPAPRHHALPPPKIHHHRHSSPFVVGVGVGFVGGLLADAFAPKPVVIATPPPIVVRNPVWIPPVYENRPVFNVFGQITHYEQVLVRGGYWQY